MRICLISTELSGFGSWGGFGSLTRDIAVGMAALGHDVYVTMMRHPGQKPVEFVDGIKVLSYPSSPYRVAKNALQFAGLYKMIDADVYHSQEPSVGTYLAQEAVPRKKHIVTFQDPRYFHERDEGRGAPMSDRSWMYTQLARLRFEIGYYNVRKAVNQADGLYCQAWYTIPKAISLYGLKKIPKFLPNPIRMPNKAIKKAERPTICFLGRWDPRKRPECFFELAKRHRDVEFIAMGGCQPRFAERERMLREKYRDVSNLTIRGWANEAEKTKVLGESWILINTSWRECLPVTYLEACAHRCAIISHENPDDFASKFGYWAEKGDIEDFSRGLKFLLESDRWRELGERGYEYITNTHEFDRVIDEHIKVYSETLGL